MAVYDFTRPVDEWGLDDFTFTLPTSLSVADLNEKLPGIQKSTFTLKGISPGFTFEVRLPPLPPGHPPITPGTRIMVHSADMNRVCEVVEVQDGVATMRPV